MERWKGDHRKCNHGAGECSAIAAWQLNGEGRPHPTTISMPVEDRFSATFDDPKNKLEPSVPLWKSKGWVQAEACNGIRPDSNVLAHLRERGVKDKEDTMKGKPGITFKETKEEIKKFQDEFDAMAASLSGDSKESTDTVDTGRGRRVRA